MNTILRQQLGLLLGPIVLVTACGGQTEVFEDGGDEARASAAYVGAACELSTPLGERETVVEDAVEACGLGICLGFEGEVACSCRCAGAAGSGPLCACPEGFSCRSDVVVDVLDVPSDDAWVGGYCLPSSAE